LEAWLAVTSWLSTHRRVRAGLLAVAGATVGSLLLAFVLVGIDRVTGGDGTGREADAAQQPSPSDRGARNDSPNSIDPSSAPSALNSDSESARHTPTVLPVTDDPDVYAEAVAAALLGMDYRRFDAADYKALLTDALWPEIVAEDQARIVATIARRIPTDDVWEQMRSIGQTSTFETELVWEPRTGRQGRDEGWWPNGVVLRNVSGSQADTWQPPGEVAQSSSRQVALSIAMACPPASSPCRLVSIQPNVES
jgi:hypothetical protein